LLSALGILLMAWGIGAPLVALTGAEAQGRITHVRRQLGDRNEAIPNRYAFAITYEFRLPDGALRTGTTQRIGDFFSPGRLGVGSPVTIHYAPFATRPVRDGLAFRLTHRKYPGGGRRSGPAPVAVKGVNPHEV
jgi:hypothetical protein